LEFTAMIAFKIELLKRRLTAKQLADSLGISETYMSDIIIGRRKAPAIRRRLIEEFNFPPRAVEFRPRNDQKRKAA
jgi:transcriptional regulator with XRE-family HTH domain